ncbi:MAG TPA: M14 family metallopeptidase [Terriglobales bacterium]|nr:M14 family metallopeptidase [Terriglobales bacterium]
MTRLFALAAVLGLALASLADARPVSDPHPTLTVGTATAARGQKVAGAIEVPPAADSGTRIPAVVVHGAKPGPVLALVAGAHGTEYSSILALEKLIDLLDPASITGSVIIVPLVNVASFEQKIAHVNPVDGKSMNRMYPGRMDGTQTDRASYLITKQVVEPSDHLIDLHGGDLDESLRPYSYWTKTGNAPQDSIAREMVLAFGLDHIVIAADRPKDPAQSRYLENTASTRGKPSLAAEAGYAGTTETDDIDLLVNGCLSVMRYLKMLPGPAAMVEHPVWIEAIPAVKSEATGIFHPLVKRGTYVGRTIFEARAPESGVVLYIRAVPSLTKGETIASIGVVAK